MPTSPTDPATVELSQALRTAVGRTYRRFRATRAPGELGDAALAVLTRLRKQGSQSLTALSADAGVTPPSMSQIVNRLEFGGYIVRHADPADGRRVLVRLTPEGERIAEETISAREEWFANELAQLTGVERAALRVAAEVLLRISSTEPDQLPDQLPEEPPVDPAEPGDPTERARS